jgi:tetratricopeptide (TPR) repeat protein
MKIEFVSDLSFRDSLCSLRSFAAGFAIDSRISRLRRASFTTWFGPILVVFFGLISSAHAASASLETTSNPSTPREFFNAGVQQLEAGKLREAEASFETALASQSERVQNPALYNLGHVRFGQGVDELKKGPAARPTAARGRAAAQLADQATRDADEALASNEVQKMVTAYMNGRGIRKELKAATKAVKHAMDTCGNVLKKWERSDGDFKSALELEPADADSHQNAQTVERSIAKLIDSLRELQQAAGMMGNKNQDLGEKLKQLKGRIPAPDMPPGAAGDDDEEEDFPNGPLPDQKEGASKEGEQMQLSPEQAAWLLQGFTLDSERRLPMGQKDTAEPKNPSRRPW